MREIQGVIDDALDSHKSKRELRREFDEFVDDVHDTWVHIWDAMDHPYETGNYREHIKKKKLPLRTRITRSFFFKGIPVGQVFNDSDVAHFVEYGTGPDKPGSKSPFGPNTPTPEMAPMRKTWARYEL